MTTTATALASSVLSAAALAGLLTVLPAQTSQHPGTPESAHSPVLTAQPTPSADQDDDDDREVRPSSQRRRAKAQPTS